ncbi:MAG: hypothetical protein PHP34_09205 [Bacteroidales bacterium]|nr:hypothetical protein [Bacteroidales bacterium]MDD4713493.1 hypothetical protein [Bacteroidales bacterium]
MPVYQRTMLFNILNQLEKDITPVQNEMSPTMVDTQTAYNDKIPAESESINSCGVYYNIPPVLQLSTMPEAIDVLQFKNPHGPTNSNGDYVSLYRFSDLTNNISRFNLYYYSSGNRIDNVYENILQGVTVKQDATFTYNAFFKAKQNLMNSRLSNLDGTPNSWYPAYANPTDWFEQITNKNNLQTSEIDLSKPAEAFSSQFSIIGNQSDESLHWNRLDKSGDVAVTAINDKSVFSKIRFKFMQVQIERNWLNFDLFNMGGWYLGGQEAGYVSSGEIENNDGIFPLYPTSFILATDLEIIGNLNTADIAIVLNDIQKNGSINLGPFNINTMVNDASSNTDILKNNGYFILGWISQLVNLSPKTDS